MSSIKNYTLKSLSHYLEIVEGAQKTAKHPLWFRGVGKQSNTLVPSLYRHPKIKTTRELQKLETDLMTRFRQRGLPYHNRSLDDDWHALFFMQHYGVPTRLLDWTENSIVGLYFALMSAKPKKLRNGTNKYEEPATLWILDPERWNRAALKHVSFTGGPLSPGDEFLNGYSPKANADGMNSYPIAVYGTHNSARIVAQQGVFTIFGTYGKPMETLVGDGTFPKDVLIRVTIPPSRIPTIRKSLLGHGITESTIYPDLEGLALESKRHFGFGE